LALQRGLQRSLVKLGAVPEYHQTDNGSAATYQLAGQAKGERAYNPDYEALLAHFGMKARRTAIRSPEQNGDVESLNGGLKRAPEQHLLLRGSREFAGPADYEAFVEGVMTRRNQGRQAKLTEELAVMAPLAVKPLPPYQAVRVKVTRGSLIRVQNNVYSVPTHLIGREVEVRIYEWHLEVYYHTLQVEHLSRLVGQNKQGINYRHLVKSLLHKPGGFRDYQYREAMFPQLVFRQAWEQLQGWYSPRKADLTYLRVLHLAAFTLECDVADALIELTGAKKRWDETDVERLIRVPQAQGPALLPVKVNPAVYDRLLQAGAK
jgi:transposase InsO family protein